MFENLERVSMALCADNGVAAQYGIAFARERGTDALEAEAVRAVFFVSEMQAKADADILVCGTLKERNRITANYPLLDKYLGQLMDHIY